MIGLLRYYQDNYKTKEKFGAPGVCNVENIKLFLAK